MKVSISLGKSVLTFLVLLMMPMLVSAWQDGNYTYCRNITISSAIEGTYFYELENSGFNYSHVSNASGYDIRFYNGSCADSGQAEFEYFREDYNPNGNSYFFIDLSETTDKIAMYYGYNESADVSNQSVFRNLGDVTFKTTTDWTEAETTLFNKYAYVNTTARYVQLKNTEAGDCSEVYGVTSLNYPTISPTEDYAIWYRANLTATEQGGGIGVAFGDFSQGAIYQQTKGSFFASPYAGSYYYIEGWIDDDDTPESLSTNLATDMNGIEHYGYAFKSGNTYNLTISSNRNMSSPIDSGQKTTIRTHAKDMDNFYPFLSYATGFSCNNLSGWINQTYVTSYTTETFTTMGEEATTTTSSTTTTTTSSTTTTITPTTTTIPTGDIISQMSPVISGLLGVFLCLFIAGVFFFMKKSFK